MVLLQPSGYFNPTKAPRYRLVWHPDINFCHLIQRRWNKISAPQNRSLSSALIEEEEADVVRVVAESRRRIARALSPSSAAGAATSARAKKIPRPMRRPSVRAAESGLVHVESPSRERGREEALSRQSVASQQQHRDDGTDSREDSVMSEVDIVPVTLLIEG